MRVLSGIQPTGRFHWGNYFGAIRQYIDLQGADEAYYFIANLHALTTVRDPSVAGSMTLDAAIDLLALGLDPQRAVLFVQSDVPEVSELCWLLMTGAPMGLLERCHAYKDKKAKGLPADAGLVHLSGADGGRHPGLRRRHGAGRRRPDSAHRSLPRSGRQLQSSLRRDVRDAQGQAAGRLGESAGHRRRENVARATTTRWRCSKTPKRQRKKIMRITTDSRPMDQPKEPETDHLFQLYSLVATDAESAEMAALYRRGGFGYGEVKKALAELAERFLAEPRARRAEFEAHPERVREILADGASRARRKAVQVLDRAKKACGLKL